MRKFKWIHQINNWCSLDLDTDYFEVSGYKSIPLYLFKKVILALCVCQWKPPLNIFNISFLCVAENKAEPSILDTSKHLWSCIFEREHWVCSRPLPHLLITALIYKWGRLKRSLWLEFLNKTLNPHQLQGFCAVVPLTSDLLEPNRICWICWFCLANSTKHNQFAMF